MEKIRKYIIAFILLSGIYSQAQPVQLRIPDSTSIVGDIILMPVYVDSSLTGLNVLSYQFEITYTSSRLNYISIETIGTLSQVWSAPLVNTSTSGLLSIAGAGTVPLSGTGVLFYLQLECINTGTAYLNFDGGMASNFLNEHVPEVVLINGSVSISAAPSIHVTPENGLLLPGDQLQFNVSGGTAPYSWYSTNPGAGSVNSSGLLTAISTGFTKVVAEDAIGIRDTINDYVEIRSLKVQIPDTSAWQGSVVDIPVYISDVSTLNVLSGNFNITFNQNILNAISFNKTGTLLENYSNILFNNSIPGELNIVFAGTTFLTGSGVLLYIQMEVSSVYTGGTWISFNDVLFNEDILAKTVNGYFSTINFSNINITPNTYDIVAGETVQFSASGGISPYTWSSSNNTVATIDASGLLTAHQSGIIQISATDGVGAMGTSGDITVYDTYLSIPDVYASVNSVYDLPVFISDIPAGQSVFSIQGTISFETPELNALDIVLDGTLTSGWSSFKIVSGNEISFAIAGTTSFNEAGVMFKVRFQLTPDLLPDENAWVNIEDIMLNEGIPLAQTGNGSITAKNGIIVSINAFLEGPFNGLNMNTDLNPLFIPYNQPYNTSPWNYSGGESFGAVPNGDVVDWVLIELRETAGGAFTALPATMIDRQAALILNNGEIVGTDGIRNLVFEDTITQNLYAIVWHRNHIGIMSAIPLILEGGIYSYDFTIGENQVYGGSSAHKQIAPGIWGMIVGDGNADGIVDSVDKVNYWNIEAGMRGYLKADFNMDTEVDNVDKDDFWWLNEGSGSMVPE